MTHKNNLLPFEEQTQLINEEQLIIQELLSQFQQPIPANFVELEQLKWMCSTEGWKEPSCERYGCLINGEWKQVDIRHTLLEKLGLEAKNIPYPVYVSFTVLEKGLDRYFAYNVENEEEVFLIQPFTINDLPAIFQGWTTEIEQLKSERDDYRNKWDNAVEELEQKGEIIKSYLRKMEELGGEKEENQKIIEDLKKQLAEINEKDLKIKELEEKITKIQQEVKKAKQRKKEAIERLKQEQRLSQATDIRLKREMGSESLQKFKEKLRKDIEREQKWAEREKEKFEAKVEVNNNNN